MATTTQHPNIQALIGQITEEQCSVKGSLPDVLPTTRWQAKGSFTLSNTKVSLDALYFKGAAEVTGKIEDHLGWNHRDDSLFVYVTDGVSDVRSLFGTRFDPLFNREVSCGQAAALSFRDAVLHDALSSMTVEEVATAANNRASRFCKEHGLPLSSPHRLGGATGVLLKICGDSLEVIQWGDAGFAIQYKDGRTIHSNNQVYWHDLLWHQKYPEYKRKAALEFGESLENFTALSPEKKQMILVRSYELYAPVWGELIDSNVNHPGKKEGYGLLNGTSTHEGIPSFFPLAEKATFSLNELSSVLLFSDGIAVFTPEKERENQELVRDLFFAAERNSAHGLLYRSFTNERGAHIDPQKGPEATSIVLQFSNS